VTVPQEVVSSLIQAGVLGPILVACGWYVLRLQRELREVHGARTADAQAVTDRVLALQAGQHEVSQQIATTQERTAAALAALVGRLERLEEGQTRLETAFGASGPGGRADEEARGPRARGR
jgi:hypothetical protein